MRFDKVTMPPLPCPADYSDHLLSLGWTEQEANYIIEAKEQEAENAGE